MADATAEAAARRERRARGLGIATALIAMLAATLAIGWPAPGVSAAIGLLVYSLARREPS